MYSAEELEALAPPVTALATGARRVHVLFNNCHGDKAQRNAAQFRDLLAATQAPKLTRTRNKRATNRS